MTYVHDAVGSLCYTFTSLSLACPICPRDQGHGIPEGCQCTVGKRDRDSPPSGIRDAE